MGDSGNEGVMTKLIVITAVVCLGAAFNAAAETPPSSDEKNSHIFTPVISAGAGAFEERTTLALSEFNIDEDRRLWTAELGLGIGYKLPSGFLPAGTLQGVSLIGAGVVFRPGDWPVRLTQEAIWDFEIRRFLHLSWGIGLSAAFNATRWSRSAMSVNLPLAIRLGWVSIVYSPGFNIPISKEERPVYDGTKIQETAPGFSPFYFYLRLHLPVLGW